MWFLPLWCLNVCRVSMSGREKYVCGTEPGVPPHTHTCINSMPTRVSLYCILISAFSLHPDAVSAESSCSLLESDPPPVWEVQWVLKKSSDNGLLSTGLDVTEGSISPCLTGLSQISFSSLCLSLFSFLFSLLHISIQKKTYDGVLFDT